MADNLSLLFQLKATNQASPAIRQVQGDVSKLTKSASTEFNALQQVTTASLGKITSSLTALSGQLPVVGNAVQGLSSELGNMATATEGAGAEFAAVAGPIGIAVVAIGAAVVGVLKLSEALFSLGKAAADSQGKLYDLSQQTGVSVETLSALGFLAEQTGGNIEAVSASLGIFQKNLEDATDPTTKQAEAFKKLGVEVTDTEETLRATLKALAAMPVGFQQTAAALELFGRGGKQILAILKEANGDIDTTIKELAAMGIGSSDAAKQADKFNDQLGKLHTQLQGVVNLLGNQMIPTFIKAGEIIQKTVTENKDGIEALGIAVKALGFVIASAFVGAIKTLDAVWQNHKDKLQLVVELYERLAAAIQGISGKVPNITGNEIGAVPLGGASGQGGLKELKDLLEKAAATDASKQGRPFNLQQIFGEFDKAKADAIHAALERQKKLQEQINEIKKKTAAVDREIEAEEAKRQRAIEAEIQSLNSFIEAQTRAIHGSYTALEQTNEFILRFGNLSGAMDENQQSWLRFNAIIIDTNENLKQLPDFIREAARAMAESGPQFTEGTLFGETDALNPDAPAPPTKKIDSLRESLDLLAESATRAFGITGEAGQGMADLLGGAVSSLAQGFGSLVQQWVLLGGQADINMKKLVATVLAGVAAQAASLAVFELALAIAALTPFGSIIYGSAAQHFAAAALFGSIAAGSALAGRAVAGDSFQQKPQSQTASGGGSRGGGGSSPATSPTPIDVGRTNYNTQVLEHVIRMKVKGDAVVDEFVKDFDLNGRTRVIITSDR